MVYSCAGSSDLFLIFGCMPSTFMFLSFSTLRSCSLRRSNTIIVAKLNTAPTPPPPNLVIEDLQYQNKLCDCLAFIKRDYFFPAHLVPRVLIFVSAVKTITSRAKLSFLLALAKKGAFAAIPQEQARGGRWEEGKGGSTLAKPHVLSFPFPSFPSRFHFSLSSLP